ncbi:hypothetical protein B1A85_01090 [Chroococcidiopsis sp. TS-821]|nr:hypothetical protein B1A85_01090 [Chroococcidiopsis sp. TS-821]
MGDIAEEAEEQRSRGSRGAEEQRKQRSRGSRGAEEAEVQRKQRSNYQLPITIYQPNTDTYFSPT